MTTKITDTPPAVQHPQDKPSHAKHAGMFDKAAGWTSAAAGRASTFMIAAGVVVVWAVTGPIFQFSDTWQLIINTGTTIVTFLMVFLIQNSQNRDSSAIQAKLDELIRVSTATNAYVGIERLSDDEIKELRQRSERRAKQDESDDEFGSSSR